MLVDQLSGGSREQSGEDHPWYQEYGTIGQTTATVCLIDHPAVVSSRHDAGLDYRTLALWQTPRAIGREETLQRGDPVRIDVTIAAGEETLRIRLDDSFGVVEFARDASSGTAG